MACIGIVIRQLPSFALQAGPGSSDYTGQMALIHDRYDPAFGAAIVDLLERLQVFRVFTSAWFSGALVLLLISIVVCTLDRTPRLWRQSVDIRVAQPDGYFDPALPDRALMPGASADTVRDGAAPPPVPGRARRPARTACATCTAIATSTRRWRRCSPTRGSSCSSSRPP